MSQLFIVTTTARYLQSVELIEGLFAKDSTKIAKEISNLKSLDHSSLSENPPVVCRVKNELIFGASCLDSIKGDIITPDKRQEYIKALFADVIGALKEEEKKAVREIYLFAHGYDLNRSGDLIAAVQDHPLFADLSWLKTLMGRANVAVGKGGQTPDINDGLDVYFTAFSHNTYSSGDNIVYDLLRKGREGLREGYGTFGAQLQACAKFLLDGWVLEQGWRKDLYVHDEGASPSPGFAFKCHVWDGGKLRNNIDSGWDWEDLWKKLTASAEGDYQVNVVFLPLVAISEYKSKVFYREIVDSFFKKDDSFFKKDFQPTIFVSYWDIMSTHENWQNKAYFAIDRRYRFLDSSIWCRYVPIQGNFWENLDHALKTVKWAYDNNLYQSNVCREYIEFQSRMLLNSHLDGTYGTGHAMKVFPFTFHSEAEMESKAQKTWKTLHDSGLGWNMLLVDDYADSPLREGHNEGQGKSKGEIVESLILSGLSDKSETKGATTVNVDQAVTVDSAVSKMGCSNGEGTSEAPEKVYDIILLDYLFSHPKMATRQHFGTELLDRIKEAKRRDGIGVMQSYWIYPISVFNEAIQSHMQEKGYQYFENYWQLARGADPLNTPHLFRRSLFKFMEAQMAKVQFTERDIWLFLAEKATGLLKAKRKHFTRTEPESEMVLDRVRAQSLFRLFIERFSMDEGLPEKSALAQSIRTKLHNDGVKDLRDHLGQLLYILGFSVGFDFPIIEREYRFVESCCEKFVQEQNGEDEREKLNEAIACLAQAVFSIYGKYY